MAKFISLFAGVGGFDLGMEKAGHECVAQVEWDKNAAGVLKHRWPNVPLFCDVSKVSADDLPDADFITYGFPCQDLSVAGKREGLNGKRSGLFYEATRLIRELRARGCGLRFALAENVRGIMSADDGLALARCIRELLDCGACEVGFRILDSQYFGVAQRRKRAFIISDFGGESCDEILAITESLPGHPPPSREAGKGTAGDATKSVGEGRQCYEWHNQDSRIREEEQAATLSCNAGGKEGNLVLDKKPINLPESDIVGTLSDATKSVGEGGLKLELPEVCATITGELAKHTNNQMVQNAESFFIPKVQGEQKETYCLQGGGETSQSGNGLGVDKDVSFTLNGLDKHGVVSWNGDITPKTSEDVSQGVDVYNGQLTGETGCTVTTNTGVSSGSGPKVMSFAPSDITRGFGQKPEVELSGTLKKTHNDNSPHVVTSQQGGEGVGVAHVSHGQARECKDVVPPLMAHSGPNRHGEGSVSTTEFTAIIQEAKAFTASDRSNKAAWEGDISGTINCQMNSESSNLQMGVRENLTVRRLTPIECERLQGFPDNWTSEKMEVVLEGNEWKATGKVLKQADGPRYKQMGNAVTVNVAEWIGKQIGKVLL